MCINKGKKGRPRKSEIKEDLEEDKNAIDI